MSMTLSLLFFYLPDVTALPSLVIWKATPATNFRAGFQVQDSASTIGNTLQSVKADRRTSGHCTTPAHQR